jgi:hypothetical protein
MKLELKDLAPYLPYGVQYKDNKNIVKILKSLDAVILMADFGHGDAQEFKELKPILRPLSDLQNEEYENKIFNREYIIDKEADSELGYYEWCYLFKNHFDVFGIIEKGLAIDINTLK